MYTSTGPLLYAVETPKHGRVPVGFVKVCTVTYEEHLVPEAEFDQSKYKVHDANSPQARLIAQLVELPAKLGGSRLGE